MGTRHVRVHAESLEQMRTSCKSLFIKAHPEFSGMHLSDAFMFKKLVDYYME